MNQQTTPCLAIIGQAAIDVKFPQLRYELVDGRAIRVSVGDGIIDIPLRGPFHLPKVPADVPAALWHYSVGRSCGGGGPNSVVGAVMNSPGQRIRYLESARPDDLERCFLSMSTVALRSLDLREIPVNAVFSDPEHDKLILLAELSQAEKSDIETLTKLAWLKECDWLLVNSPKDRVVFEYLVGIADGSGPKLCLVLTHSAYPELVLGSLMPRADVIIGSWDEVPRVMGWEPDLSLSGAGKIVRRLQETAPRARVMVTMGDAGVLVAEPGGQLYKVSMCGEAWQDIQRLVSVDANRLTGVGDSFAGALSAYLVSGNSILGPVSQWFSPEIVAGAVAATAVAARWVGLDRPLGVSDFKVEPINATKARCACATGGVANYGL